MTENKVTLAVAGRGDISQAKSGKQPNDPDKAAQALLRVIEADEPPTRIFLGEDALAVVGQKLEQMRAEIAVWEPLSRSTGFAA